MNQASDIVRKFFEDYERGSNAADPTLVTAQYSDSFMFAGPQGAQAVSKADFLKALPKREGFFKAVGLTASKIQTLQETRLDEHYILVKVTWQIRFEKEPERPLVEEIAATYLLYQQDNLLRIVLQLDHQDLMQRVQALGLLPARD
ncbi:MAG: hypothetical protein FOGNACKC_02486 [Anaerolineae bacterium]|nr:hypothetical protein [Anaerolineae bacterium]